MRFDSFPTSWQLAVRLFRAASFAIFLAAFALALPGCGTGSGDDAVADGGQALPENLAASAGATDQDDVTAEMGTAPQQIVEGADGTRWAAGRILVQPRAGLSDEEMEKIANRHAGRGLGKIQQINVHVIEVPPQAEEAVAKALANNKHVAFAERDMGGQA